MRRLRSLGVASVVSVWFPALVIQACDDQPSSENDFDASAPDVKSPDEQRTPTPADGSVDAPSDDAGDAATPIEAGLNDGSAPISPVHDFDEPYAIAVDTQYLYVAARTQGIFRVAKGRSTSERMTIGEAVWRMALNDDRLFFVTAAGEVREIDPDERGRRRWRGDAPRRSERGPVRAVRRGFDESSSACTAPAAAPTCAQSKPTGEAPYGREGLRPYDMATVDGYLFAGFERHGQPGHPTRSGSTTEGSRLARPRRERSPTSRRRTGTCTGPRAAVR